MSTSKFITENTRTNIISKEKGVSQQRKRRVWLVKTRSYTPLGRKLIWYVTIYGLVLLKQIYCYYIVKVISIILNELHNNF